ncbi:hypothetical protein [Denitratimonas sp. CY0512]|uniref:hypothetical protein n=1 Tax=Denitratimonas sp. CY0512 TaxID=3131940 RepID=UPI00309EC555
MILRSIFTAGMLMLASGTTVLASPIFADGFEERPPPATASVGGTNYLWFGDDGQCSQASRDAFGLAKRYHEIDPVLGPVRAIAQQQLAVMHERGMRRLSLGIFFIHGPTSSGTLVDSSNPAQVAQAAANIGMLMQDVKNAGYNEVLFRFFPTANINPSQPEFPAHSDNPNSDYARRVDEYWNLIQAVRPVLAASGLHYRIDLMVEGAPRDSNPPFPIPENERYKYPANERWSKAVRTLWQRYLAAYGRDDTVGFSFLVDEDNNRLRSRVRHMQYVYEGNYPFLYAIDFYAGDTQDEYEKFMRMHGYMVSQNPSGASWHQNGWIIAEAHYEDPIAAQALARAIRETGRTVFYLTQWPLDRAAACQQAHVNVPPPYDWMVWPAYGF